MGWLANIADMIRHWSGGAADPVGEYTPLPPHRLNVPGPFYVQDGCCISCGVWEDVAPDLLAWAPNDELHCYVARQPETDAEFERMQSAMKAGEVDCIRVRGCRPAWAARLQDAGLGHHIDKA